MPLTSDGKSNGFREEMSLYSPLIEYRVAAMALDHFFREVVEANVPLETDLVSGWWHRKIVTERVNRYSERWCVLFECIANLRERMVDQMPLDNVDISDNLEVTWSNGRRDPVSVTWVARDDGRF